MTSWSGPLMRSDGGATPDRSVAGPKRVRLSPCDRYPVEGEEIAALRSWAQHTHKNAETVRITECRFFEPTSRVVVSDLGARVRHHRLPFRLGTFTGTHSCAASEYWAPSNIHYFRPGVGPRSGG